MQNNKKGNIAIFNRETQSVLQNSAFIEDVYSESDNEDAADDVSHNQCEALDETMANDLSTLADCTVSNGNHTADYDGIDDNDADAKFKAFANGSVIVIDDD